MSTRCIVPGTNGFSVITDLIFKQEAPECVPLQDAVERQILADEKATGQLHGQRAKAGERCLFQLESASHRWSIRRC